MEEKEEREREQKKSRSQRCLVPPLPLHHEKSHFFVWGTSIYFSGRKEEKALHNQRGGLLNPLLFLPYNAMLIRVIFPRPHPLPPPPSKLSKKVEERNTFPTLTFWKSFFSRKKGGKFRPFKGKFIARDELERGWREKGETFFNFSFFFREKAAPANHYAERERERCQKQIKREKSFWNTAAEKETQREEMNRPWNVKTSILKKNPRNCLFSSLFKGGGNIMAGY